ncbi:SETMR methyltransferase, partial [Acromyrmex charruanus]
QKMDQRICIKFCVKNKIKCANAFRMLTVTYGEATLDRSNVYRWYKMFSEGREDVNDEERAGRPSTSTTDENIDEVKKIVLANRRITVREVAEDLNISIGSCHSIFTNDLGMRRVAAKFVPKLREFLAKNNTLMMPQPPYSSDLAPCDFFLFSKLKRPMKGRRYATIEEIKTASKEELNKITKNDFLVTDALRIERKLHSMTDLGHLLESELRIASNQRKRNEQGHSNDPSKPDVPQGTERVSHPLTSKKTQ